jgi:hypothetical protein
MVVCSRKIDLHSKEVVKYTNLSGRVIQTMPTRELKPDVTKLSEVAKFLYEKMNGIYIGGFNSRRNTVFVKGSIGSQWKIDVDKLGLEYAENMAKAYNIDKSERAKCEWLFGIIEPNQTDEDYINNEAKKMAKLAGVGGQIVCRRVIDNSGYGLNEKTEEFCLNL